jgi:adenosylcobinamide kinase/adenosylcobinamide-phosphate guanylyltransferase
VAGCRCAACLSQPAGTTASLAAVRIGGLAVHHDGSLTGPGMPSTHLAPGGRTAVDGVRVLALPGGPLQGAAAAVLVLGAGGSTLLWAAGTGPLPEATLEALTDAGLDGAALDVRSRGDDGRGDPIAVAHEVARLRAVRALSPGCDVLAVGWSHASALPRAADRLAAWGVRWPADADPWPRRVALPRQPRRTLVLGPASSGKSAAAEDLLAAEPEVVYAATGPRAGEGDARWSIRVADHRRRRPPWWSTDESGDLARLLTTPGPPLLVDALGTWLAAVLDRSGAWDAFGGQGGTHGPGVGDEGGEEGGEAGTGREGWRELVQQETDALVEAWRQAARRVVAVGEEVGWGVVPATVAGNRFREALGELTRRLARESERVVLVVAGTPVDLSAGAGTRSPGEGGGLGG